MRKSICFAIFALALCLLAVISYKNVSAIPAAGISIGDAHEGGIVVYINEERTGGLLAWPTDLGEADWETAMEMCNNLGDGWRLPTLEELDLICQNREAIGGFTTGRYWSSTEHHSMSHAAGVYQFSTTVCRMFTNWYKLETFKVRAVRSFSHRVPGDSEIKPDPESPVASQGNRVSYMPGIGLLNRVMDMVDGSTYLVDIFGGRTAVGESGQPLNPEALDSLSRPLMESNPGVDWHAEMEAAYAVALEFVQGLSGPTVRLVEGTPGNLSLSEAGHMLEQLLGEPAPGSALTGEEHGLVQAEALVLALRQQDTDPYGLGPTRRQEMTADEYLAYRRASLYNRRYACERDLHVNLLKTISADEWDQIASTGGQPHLVAHELRYAESRDFYVDYGYMSGEEWDSLVAAGRNPIEAVSNRQEMDRMIKLVQEELGQLAIDKLEEELGLDFEAAEALRRDLLELGADDARADEMVRATQMLRVIVHFGQDHTFSEPGAMQRIVRFVDSWCKRSQAQETIIRHVGNNLRDLSDRQLELIQRADREGLIEALQDKNDFVDESILKLVLQYAEEEIKDQVQEKAGGRWWPW